MKTLRNKVAQKRRQEEALVRQAATRSPQAQLAHLDSLGIVAAKERAKLAKRIRKGMEKAFAATPEELGGAAVSQANFQKA
jgi:hypothetical protein